MAEFNLVDLISQRKAVKSYLKGLGKDEILSWLRSKGDLIEIPESEHDNRKVYMFTSSTGIEAMFFIEDDEIVFIGDHYTFL